jgi:N-acetylglucosamine kinase-like BadF-type ATPase
MPGVLGVDGGNTKTIACVADLDGRIIGSGRSGSSDIYGYPSVEAAVAELAAAVEAALAEAGCSREELVSGGFSLAGADWPEDYRDLQNALRARGFGQTITVYNDAIGALRAGSPDGTGVVIACGTGGAIGARNASGQFWHTSYWQDSLCGRELGQQMLRAVRHAALGIEPPTTLTAHVLTYFSQADVEGVIRRFFLRPVHPPGDQEVSKLAPLLLTEAENGDIAARSIVEDHGRRLAEYALAAARKVDIENTPFTLVLNGGVFRHPGQLLKTVIADRIRQTSPDMQWVLSRHEPVIGALLLAFEAIGIPITASLLAHLEQTAPPAALFKT